MSSGPDYLTSLFLLCSVDQQRERAHSLCPRLPRAIWRLLAVHWPPNLCITLHATSAHHHHLLHHSVVPSLAPQCHRWYNNSPARHPEKKTSADFCNAAAGGRGVCSLLVPPQLLRGAALQPGNRIIQRPLLLLSLAGHELHLLQSLHLLLPEPNISPGAAATLWHVQEAEECGWVGTRAPPRSGLHSPSPIRLAWWPGFIQAEARFTAPGPGLFTTE